MSLFESDPIRNDARRAKRARRMGAPSAAAETHCARCGFPQLEALVPVRRSLLEAHHVVGRANDGGHTVPLCRNCHGILTEQLRDFGAPMSPPDSLLAKHAAMERALAVFHYDLAQRHRQRAAELAALVRALDARCPSWRTLPEAQPQVAA